MKDLLRKIMFLIELILIFSVQSIHVNKIHQKQRGFHISSEISHIMTFYRNDSQIQTQISNIIKANQSIFKKKTCSNDGNYSYLIVDDRSYGQDKTQDTRTEVIITCNIHARELLVSEVCLDFIKKLAKYNVKKTESNDEFSDKFINFLLENTRLTIFYRGNDLRDKVIAGKDYCIRKDKNDIDINRNFPTNFNRENVSKLNQQYPGSQPLSQPFSKCLINQIQSLQNIQKKKVNAFIDIHTGQFSLFDSFHSEDQKKIKTMDLLYKVKEKYCKQCRISSLGNEKDHEISNGQMFADIKKRYGSQHSVLFEIYGGFNQNLSQQQSCFVIFNPFTQRSLDYFKNKWINALAYFLKLTTNYE